MRVIVLVSTIDDGIRGVARLLPSEQDGVTHVVSWQRTTDDGTCDAAATLLRQRSDVTLSVVQGRGLCRNRNNAIAVGLSLLSHPLEDAIFVIADDDERLVPEAVTRLRALYAKFPKLDGALLRVRSIDDGSYFKSYPAGLVAYARRPRSYYPCSVEMTFRTRVWQSGLRFDERFGLGSAVLCAGEEEVLLHDMTRCGLNILVVPEDLCETVAKTTGSHTLDVKMLRSKGAVYAYEMNGMAALARGVREAISLGVRHRRNPWHIFRNILFGVKYIREWRQS